MRHERDLPALGMADVLRFQPAFEVRRCVDHDVAGGYGVGQAGVGAHRREAVAGDVGELAAQPQPQALAVVRAPAERGAQQRVAAAVGAVGLRTQVVQPRHAGIHDEVEAAQRARPAREQLRAPVILRRGVVAEIDALGLEVEGEAAGRAQPAFGAQREIEAVGVEHVGDFGAAADPARAEIALPAVAPAELQRRSGRGHVHALAIARRVRRQRVDRLRRQVVGDLEAQPLGDRAPGQAAVGVAVDAIVEPAVAVAVLLEAAVELQLQRGAVVARVEGEPRAQHGQCERVVLAQQQVVVAFDGEVGEVVDAQRLRSAGAQRAQRQREAGGGRGRTAHRGRRLRAAG